MNEELAEAKSNDEKNRESLKEDINDLEQYGRRNNLRFDGIADDHKETAEQTGQKVAQCLNAIIPNLHIRRCDVDIAHRLNRKKDTYSRPRQIIVKFVSRYTRDTVWQNRRLLTRSRVFINEDLTQINARVLTCIRKKLPAEVESSWSNNGRLYFKNKSGSVHEVTYQDYNRWLELKWPEETNGTI